MGGKEVIVNKIAIDDSSLSQNHRFQWRCKIIYIHNLSILYVLIVVVVVYVDMWKTCIVSENCPTGGGKGGIFSIYGTS
jgi:hypothetical protein